MRILISRWSGNDFVRDVGGRRRGCEVGVCVFWWRSEGGRVFEGGEWCGDVVGVGFCFLFVFIVWDYGSLEELGVSIIVKGGKGGSNILFCF